MKTIYLATATIAFAMTGAPLAMAQNYTGRLPAYMDKLPPEAFGIQSGRSVAVGERGAYEHQAPVVTRRPDVYQAR